jgi:hypothetical protein
MIACWLSTYGTQPRDDFDTWVAEMQNFRLGEA